MVDSKGKAKLRATAARLKGESEEQTAVEEESKDEVMNQLATIRDNSELSTMYSENAQVGAKNLAGELPLLKVHSSNKSLKNVLSDGGEPDDGWFFYKTNGEQFETVKCHILTISRGFRTDGMDDKKDVFNQILGGLIIDGEILKPFIMYFTGLKLSNLWDFGKAANKYTHAKPVPIPMFALTVKLKTEKVDSNYGKSWVVAFEIVENKEKFPELVTDTVKFQFLKDSVETVETTIKDLIDAKSTEDKVVPIVVSNTPIEEKPTVDAVE